MWKNPPIVFSFCLTFLNLGTDGTRPLLNDLCECINPWEGQTFNQHIGEPKNTCPNFCYVSCNSDCNDKKPAKGKGRCYSEAACNQGISKTPNQPQGLCSCINPWEGQKFNQHIGDPQNTCPTFCYVGCTSVCNDKKAIKGAGKCYSEAACNQYIIKTPTQPIVPEVNISLLARIDLSQDDVPY